MILLVLPFLLVGRNGCSLCWTSCSARSHSLAPFGFWRWNQIWFRPFSADLQRRLARSEIHYRSVSSTHLDEVLQQQITTNDCNPSLCLERTSPFLFPLLFLTLLIRSARFLSITALMSLHLCSHSTQLSLQSATEPYLTAALSLQP